MAATVASSNQLLSALSPGTAHFKLQLPLSTASACAAAAAVAVLVLKLIICPLAAGGLLRLLKHIEAPYAHKVPVAPLASIIEMGLKMAAPAGI